MAREGEPIFDEDDLPVPRTYQQAVPEDRERFADWAEKQTWVFSQSSPHEYLVKEKPPPEDRQILEAFVCFADENGYNFRWSDGKVYRCFDIGDYKYGSFVSNDPEEVEQKTIEERAKDTNILNRAKMTGYTEEEIERNLEERSHGVLFGPDQD